MLRVALVDDERLARQALRQSLARMPDLEIVGEADGVAAARSLLSAKKPDAVFLDIRMPRADGFELLKEVERPPKVVFVTAHSEHAVRAFEVEAVDYLLKPVRATRLAIAVQRLRAACGLNAAAESTYSPGDRICLRTPGRTLVATLDTLTVLEADGDFTRIFVAGEPALMICQNLGAYVRQLPNPPFLRVDRSRIVNMDRITKIERVSRDDTLLHLAGIGEPLRVGRVAHSRLRDALG